jgi:hypothetical protein
VKTADGPLGAHFKTSVSAVHGLGWHGHLGVIRRRHGQDAHATSGGFKMRA